MLLQVVLRTCHTLSGTNGRLPYLWNLLLSKMPSRCQRRCRYFSSQFCGHPYSQHLGQKEGKECWQDTLAECFAERRARTISVHGTWSVVTATTGGAWFHVNLEQWNDETRHSKFKSFNFFPPWSFFWIWRRATESTNCCNNGIQDHQLYLLSTPGSTMLTSYKKVEWLD